MDSDNTLFAKILSAVEGGKDLDSVIKGLDDNAKAKLLELTRLEEELSKIEPAEEDISQENLELMRRLQRMLGREPQSSSSRSADAFSPGNSFGAYQIVRELGRGGMGTVYEAVQIHLGKRVAVKVIAPHVVSDPQAVERFRREMRAAGRVEHDNVVRAMDAGEIQGTLYLVTEYVSGIDLAKLVSKQGPFHARQALQIISQAGNALQAAHAGGIVHRDVKPSNLVLTNDGQVKLLDLGLARLATDRQSDFTASGSIFGTPDYMAPEQWNDPKTVDGRVDLYAIGCTLFFLLTGKPPFSSEQYPTTYSKMKAHMEAPIPHLPDSVGTGRSQLENLLQRLLAKNPDQRFPNASDLLKELSQIVFSWDETAAPSLDQVVAPPGVTGNHTPAAPTVEITGNTKHVMPNERNLRNAVPNFGLIVGAAASLVLVVTFFFMWERIYTLYKIPPNFQAANNSKPSTALNSAYKSQERNHVSNSNYSEKTPKSLGAPFDEATAQKLQQEWAEFLELPIELENSLGMKFRLIPPGEFAMGFNRIFAEELSKKIPYTTEKILASTPENRVRITYPFYVQVHEVTQRAFQSITGRNPSWYAESGEKRELIVEQDTASFPVDSVSHFDAVEFCDGLSRAEGLPAAYPNADSLKQQESLIGYRLPTEAEWEMCCRAGTRTQWYTGDDEQRLAKAAWTKSNANLHPQPVGSLAQNAFGLFDMSGNISEWCQDWFSPDEYSSRKGGPTNDPRGPSSGVSHVIRGGSFNLSPPASMSAMRNFNTPERKSDNYGFRLVLETEAARTLLQSSKAKSSSELQYTLNREAAEWIVSVGGQFQLTDGRWIAKLEDIPSSQFSIQDTNLAGCQNVDLQGYVKLAKLDRLAGLSCWDTPTNDDCLNALLGARNIQNALLAVSVIRCPISNSVTQSLANCPKLQTLTLSSTQISDIAFIKSLPNLIHLAVDGCPLSDDAIGTLADFDQLKSLTIDQSHFDQVVQKRNKAIDHLESLTVFTSENSTKMSSLPPTPNLHFLEVHASLPQEFALDWSQLAKIDKLSHLQLFNIEPNTLPSRSQFPSLEYLQLNHFKLGLPEIQSYLLCASTLQKIEIEQCHFGDDLIRHQQTMPELNIKIEMKSLTDQDADAAEAIARLLPNSQVTLNGQPIDH